MYDEKANNNILEEVTKSKFNELPLYSILWAYIFSLMNIFSEWYVIILKYKNNIPCGLSTRLFSYCRYSIIMCFHIKFIIEYILSNENNKVSNRMRNIIGHIIISLNVGNSLEFIQNLDERKDRL